jgi:hypothetical protein
VRLTFDDSTYHISINEIQNKECKGYKVCTEKLEENSVVGGSDTISRQDI